MNKSEGFWRLYSLSCCVKESSWGVGGGGEKSRKTSGSRCSPGWRCESSSTCRSTSLTELPHSLPDRHFDLDQFEWSPFSKQLRSNIKTQSIKNKIYKYLHNEPVRGDGGVKLDSVSVKRVVKTHTHSVGFYPLDFLKFSSVLSFFWKSFFAVFLTE